MEWLNVIVVEYLSSFRKRPERRYLAGDCGSFGKLPLGQLEKSVGASFLFLSLSLFFSYFYIYLYFYSVMIMASLRPKSCQHCHYRQRQSKIPVTVWVAYCVENLDPTYGTVRPCALLRLDLNAGVRFKQISRLKNQGPTSIFHVLFVRMYAFVILFPNLINVL